MGDGDVSAATAGGDEEGLAARPRRLEDTGGGVCPTCVSGTSFCNYDPDGTFGSCELCLTYFTIDDCGTDGLPTAGVSDCEASCFASTTLAPTVASTTASTTLAPTVATG